MKRRGWLLVLVLLMILAIAAALLFLKKEKPFAEDRTLYDYRDRVVEEIHVVSADREVLFEKTQGEWKMVRPKPYTVDAAAVRRLDNRLRDFLAARILSEAGADLSAYGLDEPSAVISFTLDDGTEHELLIGEMTASKLQYYAKDASREQVYILGSYDVENFLLPVAEFRDRTVLTVDPKTITSIAMNRAGIPEFKLAGNDDTWALTEPLEIPARSDAVYELIQGISQITIKDFISEEPGERSSYGLSEPAWVLDMGDASGRTQTISFGAIDEERRIIYFMADGRGEIFSLSLEAFDPRRFKIGTMLDEAPLSVSVQNIERVTILEGDAAAVFDRDPVAEDIRFLCAGQPVNAENFFAMYVNIMALSAEGYDPDPAGGSPAMTVILQGTGGETVTVDFIRRDELSYFFVVNGVPKPFYVLTRKVELVKWWRDKVLEDL